MTKKTWIFCLLVLISAGFIAGCAAQDNASAGNAGPADDDIASDDDLTDDGADDGADDDNSAPTWPNNHSVAWDCYLCHQDNFNGSPKEPHNHAFAAPADCAVCHSEGNWTNQPSGPQAPVGHDPGTDCLTCHAQNHGKDWQGKGQCFVCHTVTASGTPPAYPSDINSAWDCYICHATAFQGAPQEPHSHVYNAPSNCLECHPKGTTPGNHVGPDAAQGHDPAMDCLTCHSAQHGASWQDQSQCGVCHAVTGSGTPPTYPQNHAASWDCYTCHATQFYGASQEPHQHTFTSPDNCVICHQQGNWNNTPPGAAASDGHLMAMDCLTCHAGQHGAAWQDRNECMVCHDVSGNTPPPDYPQNHTNTWNCYLCHQQALNGSPQEPHGTVYQAPAQCTICHQQSASSPAGPGPQTPGTHDASMDCLSCHANMHSVTWEDKNQCLVCHAIGTGAPKYPNNHDASWDCYICHATAFYGASQEPHSHAYDSPSQCTGCHQQGDWANAQNGPAPADGHYQALDCLTCHAGDKGASWQSKTQCFVCHNVPNGSPAPAYPQNHSASWSCYDCHGTNFNGQFEEPHGQVYPETQCTQCHQAGTGTFTPPGPAAPLGHHQTQNCFACHFSQHGVTNWPDKSQCLICHSVDP